MPRGYVLFIRLGDWARRGEDGRYSRNYISLTDHLKQPDITIWVQARGDAQEGSDWDILIILDKKKEEQNDHDNIAFPFRCSARTRHIPSSIGENS